MMTRKTDSPNTRRNHFLWWAGKEPPPRSYAGQISWEAAAREALQLKRTVFNGEEIVPDISFDAVTQAFTHFKLDPAYPLHWRLLLNRLAYMQFGERPKKARDEPKKWTLAKLKVLRSELGPLAKLSANIAAKNLAKDKKSAFFGYGISGLEKKIGEIRRSE